ncbi:putative fatty-acid amide [Phaeomoniella chlamydospora]|uniref:amidase n=1 Tax=Phaeomoniella chlamydospora TaxID=158046 RepID=A0A0G2ESN0_PHACM|nr:putative fatty-acid amide [Phaeomoniella chlamydospora]
MVAKWQTVAKKAQDHRDKSIAEVQPAIPEVPAELPLDVTGLPKELLNEKEVSITEKPAEELVEALASGKLTSVEVTSAFLRRAGLAQKLANCITELLSKAALDRAKYLDDYLAKEGKPIGPLHGLPISVKEHIPMKGLGINAGYIAWWDNIAEDDAAILKLLWKAGAVFYARTTQPQLLMHLETSSNLYGDTVNPFNRTLTSGGSSGGEGSLIGLRGSCLGIGTDIGGSIRSPAANNGLYGLRPTTFRLPVAGWVASMRGSEHILGVIGPLSTSLDGVKLFMKTLIDQQPWKIDQSLLPIPWTISSQKPPTPDQKLKVAILWDDGVVHPHPPVIRALKEISAKLSTNPSISLVDWTPYQHDRAWTIISSLYFADGGMEDRATLQASGEPRLPLSDFILTDNPNVRTLTIPEVWDLTYQRDTYKQEYLNHWNKTATGVNPDGTPEGTVDVIICPVGPGAAPPLGQSKYWGYTSQWNLLDYPALIFPVTKVDQEKDTVETGYEPRNEQDAFNYELCKFSSLSLSLSLAEQKRNKLPHLDIDIDLFPFLEK